MKNQKTWLCMVLALIVLAVMSCGPCSKKYHVVKTIEAEDCKLEKDCGLEGYWKEWARKEFSNGRLINNEASLGTAADSSKLFLTFQGIGVSIVYRQDTWYGALHVQIDDKVDEYIKQKGEIRNQVEACFELDGNGPHTLTLSGSKDTGVITIDAIKILERKE